MKVGILVVYFVQSDADWVLEKHLQHLARTRPWMEFTVYAAINRLAASHQRLLRTYEFVEIVSLPSIAERGSGEHGMYLDMLVKHAIADSCDYVATFDVDSWPIQDEWIKISYDLLMENKAVGLAILRTENGDTVLPHPSFTFMKAELFRNPQCRYWINEEERTAELRKFLDIHGQHCDTGAPLGYFLESHGLPWIALRRSNKVNVHYLMAGIYGDLVFHVGASSRERIVFRKDDVAWLVKLSHPFGRLPVMWRLERPILKLMKNTYEWSACRRNRLAFDSIAGRLKAGEEIFYDELQGGRTQTRSLSE